jgi:hypothetical protein
MSATNSYERKILKNLTLGQISLFEIIPYLGLSSTSPGETGAITEPTIGGPEGYARVPLLDSNGQGESAFIEADIDAATGTVENAREIIFPPALGVWGTVGYWFISNGATTTGDEILAYGQLDATKTVNLGETLTFAPGSLILTAN